MLKTSRLNAILKYIQNVGRCMHIFCVSDASVCSFDKHLQTACENAPLISAKIL